MTNEEAIQHTEEVGTMMSRQGGNTQYCCGMEHL